MSISKVFQPRSLIVGDKCHKTFTNSEKHLKLFDKHGENLSKTKEKFSIDVNQDGVVVDEEKQEKSSSKDPTIEKKKSLFDGLKFAVDFDKSANFKDKKELKDLIIERGGIISHIVNKQVRKSKHKK